jgi:CHAT domain-containing protein
MPSLTEDERSLRTYLLDETAPEEQRQIEERLLLDADYVELLLFIEEELIDDYVRDALSERERERFQTHFLTTPIRQRKLTKAKALRKYINNTQPVSSPPLMSASRSKVFWRQWQFTPAWRAAIAALLVLGMGLGAWRLFIYQSLTDKGRAALQAALRESPIKARMAGFNWPPQQNTLSEQSSNILDETALESAENYLRDAVHTQKSPDSHYALGQFYLAEKELDKAIKQFEQALGGDPKNAKLHSDLGAALLERARASQGKDSNNSLADFDQSLKHLNEALALDDSLLEALFNRALCLEYMKVFSQAEAAWRAYLQRDSSSSWADQARQNLYMVEQKQKNSQSNKEPFKEFLSAYRMGDEETAWKIVSQSREVITGSLIWWQLLDDYFELQAVNKPSEANARIEALQYVGKLELHRGEPKGDPYISALAKLYRSTSLKQLEGLSEAHEQINRGNKHFLQNQIVEAKGNYAQARDSFVRNMNQGEAMLADFLIGCCHIFNNEPARSLPILEQLVSECRKRGYRWLLAQSYFALAMAQDRLGEHSKALKNTEHALQISKEMRDTYNTQRSLAQIADQYRKLGDYALATSNINFCFEQISVVWSGYRQMWRNFDQLVQVLIAKRLNTAATAYAREALQFALETKNSSFISVSYVHLGLLHSKQQDYAGAIKLAQQGLAAAAPDKESQAYASLQLGHLYRQAGELPMALNYYDKCIKYIDSQKNSSQSKIDKQARQANTAKGPAYRYDAHKGKLFCLFAQGNDVQAEQELEQTIGLLEQYRENIQEEQNRNTFFNLEQSVYDAAIDFEFRRKDFRAVFERSETSRARSLLDLIAAHNKALQADGEQQATLKRLFLPMGLAEVQQRLPDQTQLIEYIVLDDKLLICLVSKSDFSVETVPIRLSELTDKVLNFRQLILSYTGDLSAEAKELYDLLIAPIELLLQKEKRICIVPDKVLYNLAFDSLISPASGRYLVEDYQFVIAPSATIYLLCSERTGHITDLNQEHLLAVGNAAFVASPSLPALPSTQDQVENIAKFYSPPSLLLTKDRAREEAIKRAMEEFDVIQLASHYVVHEGNPMKSRLILTQELSDSGNPDSSAGVLQADEVYDLNLWRRAPLIVLSACQSGVEHYYNGEGMIGISRVFLAAGAPVVVASLWKVEVTATDKLMVKFHEYRKLKGFPTAKALRYAKLDMLNDPSRKHPFYWAGFASIGGHTDF